MKIQKMLMPVMIYMTAKQRKTPRTRTTFP